MIDLLCIVSAIICIVLGSDDIGGDVFLAVFAVANVMLIYHFGLYGAVSCDFAIVLFIVFLSK